ncbi:ferritin heavy chain-like [Moschus berezovskii]|uniref:ferritin heavy chain-like n=1 Tax=Moschus berezovskii TaxID=68408 RepID=UPI0024438F4F|nr:ferritin heavy chain-like [Moschus berezovskii]
MRALHLGVKKKVTPYTHSEYTFSVVQTEPSPRPRIPPINVTSSLTNTRPGTDPAQRTPLPAPPRARTQTPAMWPRARIQSPKSSTLARFQGGHWRPRACLFLPRRCLIRAAIPWVLDWPAMMPPSPPQVRPKYRPACEAAVNSHAALEFHASFQCLAVAFYLDRDDVGLKHFSRFFLIRSHEHSKTAESLMFLQNRRGGRLCFPNIRKPETQQWESGLQAMQDTLYLEKCVHQSLIDLTQMATDSSDADLCHFLGTGYLDQQVKFIKELGDLVSNLSNTGLLEGALAEYLSDRLTLGDGDKKD